MLCKTHRNDIVWLYNGRKVDFETVSRSASQAWQLHEFFTRTRASFVFTEQHRCILHAIRDLRGASVDTFHSANPQVEALPSQVHQLER